MLARHWYPTGCHYMDPMVHAEVSWSPHNTSVEYAAQWFTFTAYCCVESGGLLHSHPRWALGVDVDTLSGPSLSDVAQDYIVSTYDVAPAVLYEEYYVEAALPQPGVDDSRTTLSVYPRSFLTYSSQLGVLAKRPQSALHQFCEDVWDNKTDAKSLLDQQYSDFRSRVAKDGFSGIYLRSPVSAAFGGLACVGSPSHLATQDVNAQGMQACWQTQALQPNARYTVLGYVLHGGQLFVVTHTTNDEPALADMGSLRPGRWNVPAGWKYALWRGGDETVHLPKHAHTQAIWGYPELALDLDHWPAVHAKEPDALTIFHKRLAQARANLQHPLD